MTLKHGIIMEGWLLPELTSPSNIKTMANLNKVLTAVMNKQCYLRKLTQDEMSARMKKKADEYAVVLGGQESTMTVYQSSAPDRLSASADDLPATSETDATHTITPPAPTTPSHLATFTAMNPMTENAEPEPSGCSAHSNDPDSSAIQPECRHRSSIPSILNPSPFDVNPSPFDINPSPFNVNRHDYDVPSNTIQDYEQLDWRGYPNTAYLGPSLTDILKSSTVSSINHTGLSIEQRHPQF